RVSRVRWIAWGAARKAVPRRRHRGSTSRRRGGPLPSRATGLASSRSALPVRSRRLRAGWASNGRRRLPARELARLTRLRRRSMPEPVGAGRTAARRTRRLRRNTVRSFSLLLAQTFLAFALALPLAAQEIEPYQTLGMAFGWG